MDIVTQYIQAKQNALNTKDILDSIKKRENELVSKIELLNDALKVVKLSKHTKIESRKKFLLDVINQALMIVFDDEYRVDIVSENATSDKFNIKYRLVLYKNGKDVSSNNELYETSGGGVLTVISFVLKIILGYINSKNRFFILDEVFSQISREYRSGIAKLLRILSSKYNFTFLIISHEGLEQEDVDLVYRASSVKCDDGFNKLQLDLEYEKHSNDVQDYYIVDIENFQAIKKITLKIKGVTVIHGPTDSGKSAIQRAIRSLVTNSFNPNLYPRWKKSRKSQTTRIRLSKVSTNDSVEYIELKYDKKVIYKTHTGEEYVGKRLAENNIMELLEKFGFAQLSKDYINRLTGDIKQQTQRIFITTQFDKLYLAEDRNGFEKIFTIIFDSHLFNQLEIAIKNDINQLERESKTLFQQKQEIQTQLIQNHMIQLKTFTDLIKYYKEKKQESNQLQQEQKLLNHKLKTINEILDLMNLIKIINNLKNIRNQIQTITDNLHQLVQKRDSINEMIHLLQIEESVIQFRRCKLDLTNITKSIDNLNLRKELVEYNRILTMIECFVNNKDKLIKLSKNQKEYVSRYNTINSLIELYTQHKLITRYLKVQSKLISVNNEINILSKLKSQLDLLMKIHQYRELLNSINSQKENIESLRDELNSLPSKYGLKICSCCNGLGYTHT